jgi:RecB family endonuclease NucS
VAVLAAQAFTQQARTLATVRGIDCVPLNYDALRGMEPNTPTLF